MRNNAATESQHSLHLHRVLEDEYITLYGPLPYSYPWSFLRSEIADPLGLLFTIFRTENNLSKYLVGLFLKRLTAQIQSGHEEQVYAANELFRFCNTLLSKSPAADYALSALGKQINEKTLAFLRGELADIFNQLLGDKKFYSETLFAGIPLTEATQRLAENHPQGKKLAYLNRSLLEEAYPKELKFKLAKDELESVRESLLDGIIDDSELEKIQQSKAKAYRDLHVARLYSIIYEREQRRAALCLSGGGIRSATFNLGILQGLARHNLIGQFDYLSTVSGGGYIGSWLSAWIHRHSQGLAGVTKELTRRPDSPLEPDPKEIKHLRTYSNYLSPQTGLLSADTWTLAAIYIRNLFLNWMVFIPLLLVVLMIPRIGVAAILHSKPEWTWLEPLTFFAGVAFALAGLIYAGYYLPRDDSQRSTPSSFLNRCLLPLIVSSILLTYFWALYHRQGVRHWAGWHDMSLYVPDIFNWKADSAPRFMIFTTALIFIGWALYAYTRRGVIQRYIDVSRAQGQDVRWRVVLQFAGAILVIILAGSLTGYLLQWIATTPTFRNPAEALYDSADMAKLHPNYWNAYLFACFAAPLLLIIFSLGTTLIVGFASRKITDEDLEWLGRFAGWILIIVVVWSTINALVLYGPSLLLLDWTFHNWQKIILTATGIISGVITIVGGFSPKTSASGTEQDQPSLRKTLQRKLTRLAAPAFLFFLVILLSMLTNWVLVHFASWMERRAPQFLNIVYYQPPFPGPEGLDWREHFWMIDHSSFRLVVALALALGALCYVMGRFIDTGKFSIHSVYGNRLERAYLGASRSKRTPNWFTDFDPKDDLPMHELRTALFNEQSFKNIESFVAKLMNSDDPLSVEINKRLSPTTKRLMERNDSTGVPSKELEQALACDLNKLLDAERLYTEGQKPEPDERIRKLLNQSNLGETRVLLNRWLLENAYPDEIKPRRSPGPLHIINIALNLMRGDNLAWQERKAETFTVSPLHTGNYLLGYRRSRYYGGEEGISLGSAFTISGAAASPNMGYMISSPLVSFLMAMFNVRLGWWLGNPRSPHGDRTFDRSVPKFAIGPVVSEALSMTDDKSPYVYLSDGGHFDNLGLYEMVLRRCRLIVVSDATTDPRYKFDSLGISVRKIRIDLGIPIEFKEDEFKLHTRPPHRAGKYCAIGTIRYSCVDNNPVEDDGVLIYIKASMSGGEPQDVIHYQQDNEAFPQEMIADQFFSESQFESYRILGSHIMDAICGGDKVDLSLVEFENRVRAYHAQDKTT